jgi:hypothetical protein
MNRTDSSRTTDSSLTKAQQAAATNLAQRLQALPEQAAPEDRLQLVLALSQAQPKHQQKRVWPWAAIAAGLLVASGYSLLQWTSNQRESNHANLSARDPVVSELQLASQLLESRYQQRQSQARRSFANRDFQHRGELMLAQLDQALQSAPDDQSLWQQRVEVLNSLTQAPDLQARGFQPVVLNVY